jgi:hypothetical protein
MASQLTIGALKPWSAWGDYNGVRFAIQQQLSKLQTATLVQIVEVTNDGGASPIGTVDVLPLVNQLDGDGNPTPHVTVFGLPYLRIQGGANAVIMDPQVGDIGVCVFASRDISKVKSTQQQANPGSNRKYSFADSVYLSTVLSASAPTQYLQFNDDGITVVTPDALILQGESVKIQGNGITLQGAPVKIGASGGSEQTLMTNAFMSYFTSTVIPALAAHGITVSAPPANSVTTDTEAS